MAPEANPPRAPHEPEAVKSARLRRVLQTPSDLIFKLSPDGQTYLEPAMLRGVPRAKLTESSPYWQRSWLSLDALLAQQAPEAALKEATRQQLLADPHNAALAKTYKRLSDNSSKYIKIRAVFAEGPYHPNQLVAKHHLPARGLCTMEETYKLACKICDMRELHRRGELSMDPFDFIRWRVIKLASSCITAPGRRAANIRSLILNLGGGEDKRHKAYQDPTMREAVLLAAGYKGRSNRFGTKKGTTALKEPRRKDQTQGPDMDKGRKAPKGAQRQSTGYAGVNGLKDKQEQQLKDGRAEQ